LPFGPLSTEPEASPPGLADSGLARQHSLKWAFADFPGAFPVTVVEAAPPHRIVVECDAGAAADWRGRTRTTFELEPIDDGARTLVTITEAAWQATPDGAREAFGNCEGWTAMLLSLRAWLEHGINLREGFYR